MKHRPPHPLRQWMVRHEVSYPMLSKLCEVRGWPQSVSYLQQVGAGHYRPAYSLAEFLAAKIMLWPEAAPRIYGYPYVRTKRDDVAGKRQRKKK